MEHNNVFLLWSHLPAVLRVKMSSSLALRDSLPLMAEFSLRHQLQNGYETSRAFYKWNKFLVLLEKVIVSMLINKFNGFLSGTRKVQCYIYLRTTINLISNQFIPFHVVTVLLNSLHLNTLQTIIFSSILSSTSFRARGHIEIAGASSNSTNGTIRFPVYACPIWITCYVPRSPTDVESQSATLRG